MTDQLHRFTFEHFGVRGEILTLESSWQAVIERHEYTPAVRDYLGQALVATTLLSGTIKFKGSLILQLQGDGPVRTMVAQATNQRMIRGMASAEGPVPADDLVAAFGKGRMVLTAEAPNGERYQGIIGLDGQYLADVIEHYFVQSEQLPSRVWLAADGRAAAGMLLQRLPGTEGDGEDWRRICMLADTLGQDELLQVSPRDLLHRLFHEEDLRLYEPEPVAFRCNCSRERVASALKGMGRDEVESILKERGSVEADCEFCNAHYRFDAVDAVALFADLPAAASPDSQQ